MDKPLEQLFSNIELVIRHLLSGIAIYAIYLLSLSDRCSHIEFLSKEPLLVLFIVGAVGFVAFSLYRIIFWAVGDGIAYLCKLSSTAHASGASYAAKYAKVLAWRRGKDFDQSLSTYFHYRWAVVHFAFIFASVLFFAICNRQSSSIIDTWPVVAMVLAVSSFVVAIWQSVVLFGVDRELYKIPSLWSSDFCIIGLVRRAGFEHAEAQVHQFAHCGAESGLFGFAAGKQALIECLDMRVPTRRHDRSHVQHGTDTSRPGF